MIDEGFVDFVKTLTFCVSNLLNLSCFKVQSSKSSDYIRLIVINMAVLV